jgi:hypothetical protein
VFWEDDIAKDIFRFEGEIISYLPYLKDPAVPFNCIMHNGSHATFGHCAILPDPPKPRRATWLEVSRWCATGNGFVYDSDRDKIDTGIMFKPSNESEPIVDVIKVRKWEDTEWHEPTVDYMGLEDK